MKAKISFLGGADTGNVGTIDWGRFTFELNKAVECDDAHIIAKAKANRFFKVEPAYDPPKAVAVQKPMAMKPKP